MNAKERKAVLLAEEVLKRLEFSYEDDEVDGLCPECGGVDPKDSGGIAVAGEDIGHTEACHLGQAMTAIKEILFEDGARHEP
ncbi:MAG TPA: hypothetical protein VMY35_14450 [Phycisphaerae bacterium]|nr:hypothetical protein [Phycisphaerae bacterium]